MNAQLRLPLVRDQDFSRPRFAVSPANACGVALVDGWRTGALALIGTEGAGKTHLAHLWAAETKARFLAAPPGDVTLLAGQSLVIEDADAWPDAESLFHLLNMAQVSGALLLTSRRPPAEWPAALPDLRSRLNALVTAHLQEPDDATLAAVLVNLFRDRHIRPASDLIPYLIWRMERSIPAARDVVRQLDEASSSQGREINRALAVEVLGRHAIGELFEEQA